MTTQRKRIWPALLFVSTLATPALRGVDWPQYRGPNHDGISPETIRTNWSAEPPIQLWKVTTLGGGFSSFTVSRGRAFTLDKRDVSGTMKGVCVAFDADTGQELWATPVENANYQDGTGSINGPRSTPVVDGDRVYVLSAYLSLYCLNPTNGAVIWSKNLVTEYGASNIGWQSAASPLIEGDLILLNCNGSGHRLLALQKSDGSEVWKGTDYGMTHSTPVATTIHGIRQVIFYTSSGLVSVAPESGSVLWRYSTPSCPYSSTSTAMSPTVGDDTVFCSEAYSAGGAAVRITLDGSQLVANERWPKNSNLRCHWATPVYCNGYFYGIFGSYSSTLPLKCVEAATGTQVWSRSGFGSGGVLLVGPYLLVLSATGDLVLVDPTPAGYREIDRLADVINEDCWNSPSFSNGRIYARSTSEAICLEVSAPTPPQPLKLSPSIVSATGPFRLHIGNEDGTPLDPGRVPGITLLAATDLVAGTNDWTPFTNEAVLTNGVLQVDDPDSVSRPQRFFKVAEPH